MPVFLEEIVASDQFWEFLRNCFLIYEMVIGPVYRDPTGSVRSTLRSRRSRFSCRWPRSCGLTDRICHLEDIVMNNCDSSECLVSWGKILKVRKPWNVTTKRYQVWSICSISFPNGHQHSCAPWTPHIQHCQTELITFLLSCASPCSGWINHHASICSSHNPKSHLWLLLLSRIQLSNPVDSTVLKYLSKFPF